MKPSSTEYPFSELDTLHHINFYSRDNWTLVRREPESSVVRGVAVIPHRALRKHGKEKWNRNQQEPEVKRISGLKYWTDYWLVSEIWAAE